MPGPQLSGKLGPVGADDGCHFGGELAVHGRGRGGVALPGRSPREPLILSLLVRVNWGRRGADWDGDPESVFTLKGLLGWSPELSERSRCECAPPLLLEV